MAKHRMTSLDREILALRGAGTDEANARLVRLDRIFERGRRPLLDRVRDEQFEDNRIMKAALARRKSSRQFSTYVRGLRCSLCGSRNTDTEFYRINTEHPGIENTNKPSFGVTGCDDCGAC